MDRSVLVIDDNTFIRKTIMGLIAKNGYQVYEADSGKTGVDIARKNIPDLITLDFDMPVLNGLETCTELRKIPELADIPIFMLTAAEDTTLKSKAFKAGVSEYFSKNSVRFFLSDYIKDYFDMMNSSYKPNILLFPQIKEDGKLVKSLISSSGFHVTVVFSEKDFLEKIESDHVFDLVLLDLENTSSETFEFIKSIRGHIPNYIPLIIMTNKDNHTLMVESLILGASDYIQKPFQRDELMARLKSHIRAGQLEREILEKNRHLEEMNRTKNEFIGIAAHDLRNPITIIKQYSFLISEGIITEETEQKKVAGVMLRESERMMNLLNEVLSINQIETGKFNIETKAENVNDFITELIEFNHLTAEKKDIKLKKEIDREDLKASVDVNKIWQVLNNFLSNGIKYSPNNTTVTVKVNVVEPRGLRISVIDEGLGIKEEEKDKVFGKFQKLSARPTAGESSFGLGLSICKQIVEAHGGEVGFKSEWEKGSEFYFTIPDCVLN